MKPSMRKNVVVAVAFLLLAGCNYFPRAADSYQLIFDLTNEEVTLTIGFILADHSVPAKVNETLVDSLNDMEELVELELITSDDRTEILNEHDTIPGIDKGDWTLVTLNPADVDPLATTKCDLLNSETFETSCAFTLPLANFQELFCSNQAVAIRIKPGTTYRLNPTGALESVLMGPGRNVITPELQVNTASPITADEVIDCNTTAPGEGDPTNPESEVDDTDGDGVSNIADSCDGVADLGVDADGDGLDAACDDNDASGFVLRTNTFEINDPPACTVDCDTGTLNEDGGEGGCSLSSANDGNFLSFLFAALGLIPLGFRRRR